MLLLMRLFRSSLLERSFHEFFHEIVDQTHNCRGKMSSATARTKRFFDIFVSVLFLPIVIILCLFIGVIYLLLENESPFFMQTRVGKNEKLFKIYKLRTMKVNTANVETHIVDSGSVTRLGSILRRTKLDELPQLLNVLRGEMSLVGPRPCLTSQNTLIEERRTKNIFSIRPGITGLAQIQGVDMSDPINLAEIESIYLRSYHFLLDIRIIVYTLKGDGSGDCVR